MTLYLWLKFLHVVSSTILFGTGIGTACTMYFANRTKNIPIIAAAAQYVVFADWIFTGTTGFIQPVTGLWMMYLMGYSFKLLWIWGSILGYLVAAFCWFPVVYLQIKMRDFAMSAKQHKTNLPDAYFRYFNYWMSLGWPAFISLLIVFYLMVNKPF